MIRLENILTPGRSLVNVPGGSKKAVIEEIAKLIGKEVPEFDWQTVYESLIAREKLGSTGFGNGIAIPHCRLKGCTAPVSAVLHLERPVDFDAIDGAPVDLLFVLLVPEAATDAHLELLRHADAESLPESVEAVVTQRIDRLDGRDRQLLRFVSVLGNSFSLDLLAEALPEVASSAEDADTWNRLGDFLDVTVFGTVQFKQELIRAAAYDGLVDEMLLLNVMPPPAGAGDAYAALLQLPRG